MLSSILFLALAFTTTFAQGAPTPYPSKPVEATDVTLSEASKLVGSIVDSTGGMIHKVGHLSNGDNPTHTTGGMTGNMGHKIAGEILESIANEDGFLSEILDDFV